MSTQITCESCGGKYELVNIVDHLRANHSDAMREQP